MLATRMINPENKSWTTLYTGSNVFAAWLAAAPSELVAVTVLEEHPTACALPRFLREAALTCALAHTHLATGVESGVDARGDPTDPHKCHQLILVQNGEISQYDVTDVALSRTPSPEIRGTGKFDGDGGVRALPSNEVYDDSEVASAKAELLSRIATSSSSSSSSSSLSSPLPLRRFSLLVLVEE